MKPRFEHTTVNCMLLRLLVPDWHRIERRLARAKRRTARAHQAVHARRKRTERLASAALRSPATLAFAAMTGFAGGRLGDTSRRVRAIEEQLATIERLLRERADGVDARTHARTGSGNGFDLHVLLANLTRIATLLNLVTSTRADNDPDPDPAPAPEGAAAAAGD